MLWQSGSGGLRFGGLTMLFYGVQLTSSIARNRRDINDTVLAALVAGAVMGTSGNKLDLLPAFPVSWGGSPSVPSWSRRGNALETTSCVRV